MSAGGHIAAMMASIKNNNLRKNKISFIPRFEKKYVKGNPIHSKNLSPEARIKLLTQLKANRKQKAATAVFLCLVFKL